MQANNLTKAPWSETVKLGKAGDHHQQALGQGWAYHRACWVPRVPSPGGAGGCWGSLQPAWPGFLCLGAHLDINLRSEKDLKVPQEKGNGGRIFPCGDVLVGGPKAATQAWSSKRHPWVEDGSLCSSHHSPRAVSHSLAPGFAPWSKADPKLKLVEASVNFSFGNKNPAVVLPAYLAVFYPSLPLSTHTLTNWICEPSEGRTHQSHLLYLSGTTLSTSTGFLVGKWTWGWATNMHSATRCLSAAQEVG